MKKILVTGGAGYIGSHTVRHLMAKGRAPESIVVFDNLSRGHVEMIPKGVNFVQGDLVRAEDIAAVFQEHEIESVIHFAALSYVGESMTAPGSYFSNNVGGGLNLLEGMRKGECRNIIFSSTCATYGMAEVDAISEDHPQQPINPYGESKLMMERMLSWYDEIHDIRSVSLRYFNAAGADYDIGEWHEPETHLIPIAMEAALGGRENLLIFGDDYPTPDGTCIRDYIHVTDLAEAHVLAMDYLGDGGATAHLNLGTGAGSSVRQVVDATSKAAGRTVPVKMAKRRPGDPAVLVANAALARKVLGWRPERELETIINSAWAWAGRLHANHTGNKRQG